MFILSGSPGRDRTYDHRLTFILLLPIGMDYIIIPIKWDTRRFPILNQLRKVLPYGIVSTPAFLNLKRIGSVLSQPSQDFTEFTSFFNPSYLGKLQDSCFYLTVTIRTHKNTFIEFISYFFP